MAKEKRCEECTKVMFGANKKYCSPPCREDAEDRKKKLRKATARFEEKFAY